MMEMLTTNQIEQFIVKLEKKNLFLVENNGELILKGEKGKMSKEKSEEIKKDMEAINFIRKNKQEIINYLKNNTGRKKTISNQKPIAIHGLTPLQSGMLFHGLYDGDSTHYVSQFNFELPEGADLDALKKSWEYVLGIHTILRTSFISDKFNLPLQCVYEQVELPFELHDYSNFKDTELKNKIDQFLIDDRKRGFDFTKPPLIRVSILKTGETSFQMVWTHHHIVFDGWSLPVLMGEFLSAYDAYVEGLEPVSKKEDDFGVFIDYIQSKDGYKEEQFWKSYLSAFDSPSLLPFVHSKLDRNKAESDTVECKLLFDEATTDRIKQYAQINHLTVNTIVQGVWAFLLSKYSGKREVAFGVIVSGRPTEIKDVGEKVGLFINTLPLCATVDTNELLVEWLTTIQDGQVQAREFGHTSLNDIQQWNNIKGDFFDSILAFENYPMGDVVEKEWKLEIGEIQLKEQSNYLFTLVADLSSNLLMKFRSKAKLLSKETTQMIVGHFEGIIHQMLDAAELRLKDIDLLTKTEVQQLKAFNNTDVAYPSNTSVIQIFEEQASKTPNEEALLCEGKVLTYGELDALSDQLANCLQKSGVGENTLVAICMDRTVQLIVGMMAILKAGGAYVPIDPNYPKERVSYILNDAQASFIILEDKYNSLLEPEKEITKFFVDEDFSLLEGHQKEKNSLPFQPDRLAYIIYTSGSTGKPKGVMVTQNNFYALISWCIEEFQNSSFDIGYGVGSICFDITIFEIFYTLCVGKKLRLLKNGLEIEDYLLKDKNIMLCTVPTVIAGLLKSEADLSNVTAITMGGEAIPLSTLHELDVDRIETRNVYGPSEDTTFSTCFRLRKDQPILIGRPISNTKAHILDEDLKRLPIGVMGELCLSGAGVSKGYLHRPDLTAEKFVNNPFDPSGQSKLYKTGDLARWRSDGNIEFMGRKDTQIKINGFRIELGEIEAVLEQSSFVSQCVVLAKTTTADEKRLVAYIKKKEGIEIETIKDYLLSKLPEFMVPSLFIEMEKFPHTLNGKIDRKQLPDIVQSVEENKNIIQPETELEKHLVLIWKDLLKVEQVSIDDSFFDLGGHSVMVMRMRAAIRKKLKKEVSVQDLFEKETIRELASHISQKNRTFELPKVTPRLNGAVLPLSFAQERLWFIDQLKGSLDYHISIDLLVKGNLNTDVLRRTFQEIINRHEVLRTTITEKEGIPYQRIMTAENWDLRTVTIPPTTNHDELMERINELINEPFNLREDFPLRVSLVKKNEGELILLIVLHHIAFDDWSNNILISEFSSLYASFSDGKDSSLLPIPVQYADYAIWQKELFKSNHFDHQLDYWKKQLHEVVTSSSLELPTDYIRPSVLSGEGGSCSLEIDKYMAMAIKQLGRTKGLTNFMILLGAFKILLSKYSQQKQICVGVPVAGRDIKEIEPMIGFFVNLIVLNSEVEDSQPISRFLEELKQTTLNGFDHQDVPFDQVVEFLDIERDLSKSPLFQVLFNYRTATNEEPTNLEGLEFEPLLSRSVSAQRDLNLSVFESSESFSLKLNYSTDLFNQVTIERMLNHLKNLLHQMTKRPESRISDLSPINEGEAEMILKDFGHHDFIDPSGETLVSCFKKSATQFPNKTAVVFQKERISYDELDKRSDQLAAFIQSRNLKRESLIALAALPSVDMIVGILAILKSGNVLVPIDPGYPDERIKFIVQDTNCEMALCNTAFAHKFASADTVELVHLHEFDYERYADLQIDAQVTAQSLAYVIYTSGSTGFPKGVMVEHKGLVNIINYQTVNFNLDDKEQIIQLFNFVFDPFYEQLFMALLNGGCLVLVEKETIIHAEKLETVLIEAQITHIGTTPGILQTLEAKRYPQLKRVTVGGEICPPKLAKVWGAHTDFYNIYGPTEASIIATIFHYNNSKSAEKQTSVSIGRPVGNSQIYLLDKNKKMVPMGGVGEIYIGGVGLARGYWNRPDLTQQQFIDHPFERGEKLYRTGDLGRWLENGEIEFKGRMDSQVKLRGQRIELGEIENCLDRSGLVKQNVVKICTGLKGQQLLAAYVVPETNFTTNQLQDFLRQTLPQYMVPAQILEIDAIPLTLNGKVDYAALPEVDYSTLVTQDYVPPTTETESTIVEIWTDLLGHEKIGVQHNFFELGGHSLMAMRVVAAVKYQLDIEISIRDIFLYPTLSQLAIYIDRQEKKMPLPSFQSVSRTERIPLSFSQERLWFFDQLEGSSHYHLPMLLKMEGNIDVAALEYAFLSVVTRHEILRTVYEVIDGQPFQKIISPDNWRLELIDQTEDNNELAVGQLFETRFNKSFDLSTDYMVRAHLLSKNKEEAHLLIILHHIASDGWSIPIFIDELVELYRSKKANREPKLKALSVQFADYSIWQKENLNEKVLAEKLTYWEEKLSGAEPLKLPLDFPRGTSPTYNGQSYGLMLDSDLSSQLNALALKEQTTLYMLLLAAFKILLHRYSGQNDISVGSPVANRSNPELEPLIGFFVNTLVLRSDLNGNPTFIELLSQLKETALEAFGRQDVPFEKIVERVVVGRDQNTTPLFQVMFSLQNIPEGEEEEEIEGLSISAVNFEKKTSAFDLELSIVEGAEGHSVAITYNSDLFLSSSIEKMINHYQILLKAIVGKPDTKIGSLPMLSAEERHHLLVELNDTKVAYDDNQTVIDLIEAQIKSQPDKIAILFEDEEVTYESLGKRVNQMTDYLLQQGVCQNDLVAMYLDRNTEMLVLILSILKCGAAYISLDPAYPLKRINYILEDTKVDFVITQDKYKSILSTTQDYKLMAIEDGASNQTNGELRKATPKVSLDQLAYIIYTSGSTGRPKGVMLSHQNLYTFTLWCKNEFASSNFEIVYGPTSTNFDLSIYEIFFTLSAGKTLRFLENAYGIGDYITSDRGILLNLVPSLMSKLLDNRLDLSNVNAINMAGEPLTIDIYERLDLDRIETRNLYGPTEDTVYSTSFVLNNQDPILVGFPIDNTQLYILDEHLNLTPKGAIGEIYLSGDNLSTGYVNRPELTKQKFIDHPFIKQAGKKIYKTGDLGRFHPKGGIEIIGRNDSQVKLNGHRIELKEIEVVLSGHPAVLKAVVLLKESLAKEKMLVAYVLPSAPFENAEVMNFLHTKLPTYMVPTVYVKLDVFPETLNGKVDKKLLPEVDSASFESAEFAEARNETEEKLVAIWKDLLALDQVGINDDFFLLGGHSLLLTRLASIIREDFGLSIKIKVLFQLTTIAKLSNYIRLAELNNEKISAKEAFEL